MQPLQVVGSIIHVAEEISKKKIEVNILNESNISRYRIASRTVIWNNNTVKQNYLSELNSFQLAGLLYIGAAIAFLPFILKNRKIEFTALRKTKKKKHLFGLILFGGILGPLFLMIGLKTANAMSVSIWLNMEFV